MYYRISLECYDSNDVYVDIDYDQFEKDVAEEIEDYTYNNYYDFFLNEQDVKNDAIDIFNSYMREHLPNEIFKVILHADNEQVSCEYEIFLGYN